MDIKQQHIMSGALDQEDPALIPFLALLSHKVPLNLSCVYLSSTMKGVSLIIAMVLCSATPQTATIAHHLLILMPLYHLQG